jgi:LmbE family N-acetylglucosaminyl deacetylase
MSSSEVAKLERYVGSIRLDNDMRRIMEGARNILAVSPHPDDMEIAAGGYLADAIGRGAGVKLVVVSDGRMGVTSIEKEVPMEEIVGMRRREQLEAVNVLGIKDLQFLEYVDTEVPPPAVLAKDMIAVTRTFRPDLVVTVDPFLPYESHSDHVNTGMAVMRAVLLHSLPYIQKSVKVASEPPAIALGITSHPNVVIPIDESIERKMQSILCHKSQFPDAGGVDARIRGISSALGRIVGSAYAEPFKVLRPDQTHVDILALY